MGLTIHKKLQQIVLFICSRIPVSSYTESNTKLSLFFMLDIELKHKELIISPSLNLKSNYKAYLKGLLEPDSIL